MMNYKNTIKNYGTIAKWLHWTTALLFLSAYMSVYYKHWFTPARSSESFTAHQIHLSIGITIAVLVVLRIIWRMINVTPNQEAGTKLEHLAAHAGHYALYAVLILMPISGYVGTGGSTNYFFMFNIPKFEDTWIFEQLVSKGLGLTFNEFETVFDFIHKDILGAWVAWLLILGHAFAALYHHFVKKDRTLIKMTTGK